MFLEALVAAICVGFTLISLVLLGAGRGVGVPLITIAMFGGGAVFTCSRLRQRWLERTGGTRILVPAGLVFPFRRRPLVIGGGWAVLMGALGFVFGGAIGSGFRWLVSAVGLFGLLIWGMAAAGAWSELFVFLAPEGLRLGRRSYSMLVHWDNIRSLVSGEMSGQPFVGIVLQDPERLLRELDGPNPAVAAAQVSKGMKSNRTWYGGADLAILPRQFGLSPRGLVEAIAREMNTSAST